MEIKQIDSEGIAPGWSCPATAFERSRAYQSPPGYFIFVPGSPEDRAATYMDSPPHAREHRNAHNSGYS